MPKTPVETFLEEAIGLDAHSIGADTVRQIGCERMAALGLDDETVYLRRLQHSVDECDALIDAIVVLETWFFRNLKAFDYLAAYVAGEWRSVYPKRRVRILSLPCATGEEPYSAAIILLAAGLAPRDFEIDAMDISHHALEVARRGVYGPSAFREQHTLRYRERWFDPAPAAVNRVTYYQPRAEVQDRLCFMQGNLLDERCLAQRSYDIIFCRNLLIYFTAEARTRALATLQRLLRPHGLLFVGHAERSIVCNAGFTPVKERGVFACHQADHPQEKPPAPAADPLPPMDFAPLNPAPAPPPPPASAFSSASKIPARTPRRDRASLEEAQRLANAGSLRPALALCRRYLASLPEQAPAHFLAGLIHQALDDEREAERCFNKALYLDPNHLEALRHLAELAQRRGGTAQVAQLRRRIRRLSEKA